MTDEQRAAFIFAQSVEALAFIEGMKAENKMRELRGESPAYIEKDFINSVAHLGYNDVIGFLRGIR